MKQRIEYIDAIKGFAILLMVIGHAIAWNYSDYSLICTYDYNQSNNTKIGGLIWQLIYSFHMLLFFMVSGFLTYKTFRWNDFFTFLHKKIRRLFIPWIFTIWIVYFVRGVIGYWFLLCLFEISIIGFILIILLEKINKKKSLIFDSTIICLIYILFRLLHAQDWSLYGISVGHFVNAFIPFFIGILLRKHNFLYTTCIERSYFYSLAMLIFAGAFTSRYFLNYGHFFNIIYQHSSLLLAITGSLIVFHAFHKNKSIKVQSILSYLGKKTLPIYILHIMFVPQIYVIGEIILKQNAVTSIVLQITYSTFISIIAIILSITLYKIIIISPLFRKLLFGE